MSNKIIKKFELSSQNLRIKNVLNQDFLMVEIYAISDINPNRNKSHFTLESMQKAIPTFYNKPVLTYYNPNINDMMGHEDEVKYDSELDQFYFDYTNGKSETPLGMIRSEDNVEIVYDEATGLHWIKFTCALWVKYSYKAIKRILKDGKKKVSVEVEVNDYEIDDRGVEIIKDFTFDGVTILGEKVTEAISGASLRIIDTINSSLFSKKSACLSFAYKKLGDTSNFIKQEEEKMLTYEERRMLLEGALSQYRNEEDIDCLNSYWIADLDESFVYFILEGNSYRANYEIVELEDGSHKAQIDMGTKISVIRSWKQFEKEGDSCKMEKESTEMENKLDSSEALEQEMQSTDKDTEAKAEMTEDKAEETTEDKEKEAIEDKEEEAETIEDKEEESVEDKEIDFSKDEEKEESESTEDEEKEESESTEDKEEESESTEGKEEESTEDKVEDESVENEEVVLTKTYSVNGDEISGDDLYSKFIDIQSKYEDVKTNFETINQKYNDLLMKIQEESNHNYALFAKNIIDAEHELKSDAAVEIYNTVEAECNKGKFTSNNDVQDFAEQLIASALYKQVKEARKSNKEFSIDFNQESNHKPGILKSDSQELREVNDKLKRI